jgi:outer membrane protein assembly factor BamD (BamD/ComL family)
MLLPLLLFLVPVLSEREATAPRKKPVLIRVDPGVETEKPEEIPNPLEAREHVEVGDFYYKRDNYKAATLRYRDAVRNDPKWAKPYEKLVRTLEKQQALEEAIEVCGEFIDANPLSDDVTRFQRWAKTLKERADKGTNHLVRE